MKQYSFVFFGVLVGVILFGALLLVIKEGSWRTREIKTITLENGTTLFVETARTPWQKMQGLSGTEQVPRDGLLFLYETPEDVGIWMKDMRYPIDILWIVDEEVVYLVEDAQPDDAPTREVYRADRVVAAVLEVEAGTIQREGLKRGSLVEIE